MADLTLTFGGDLLVGPTGDIALSDGAALTQQRVLRRLLTNAGAYIWQVSYGAGLGQFVGRPGAPAAIQAVARSQLLQEAAIMAAPGPSVTTADHQDGAVVLTIRYTDAASMRTNLLTVVV
jgi:phage baseplate assembly protein W